MARRRFDISRQKHKRSPKRMFYVFCEGLNTEPGYLAALQRKFRDSIVEIRSFGGIGVPKTIAKASIGFMEEQGERRQRGILNSYEESDETWAIFDRDEHPSYYEAVQACEVAGVGVARSNPCFEVWLILHIQGHDKPDGRAAVQQLLKRLRPDYDDKKKVLKFDELLESLELAEARAEKQYKARIAEGDMPLGAPYTTVSKLTKAIRAASNRKKK